MLKILLMGSVMISLCLIIPDNCWAAAEKEQPTDNKITTNETSPDTKEKNKNEDVSLEDKKDTNIFECQYYTVTLIPGWSVVTPPTENQGTITSIFKSTSGSVIIMLVLGNLGGADLKTIADMFAEQFKAGRQPTLKNGQYTFSFVRDGKACEAYISSMDDLFMVTTITGNRKEALDFIKKQIKSQDYAKLLPQ